MSVIAPKFLICILIFLPKLFKNFKELPESHGWSEHSRPWEGGIWRQGLREQRGESFGSHSI